MFLNISPKEKGNIVVVVNVNEKRRHSLSMKICGFIYSIQ